jgi:hypothetical protein
MMEELEDKYERFFRNTDIDLLAEIAAGGGEGGLDNYYTKPQADAITNALGARVTSLENAGGGGDLSNYYTKGETNGLLSGKQNTNTVLTQLIGLTPANDDVIQRKANAWTTRNPTQLKQDMGLDNVNNTSDANKPVSTATQTALDALDARVDILEESTGPDLTNYYTKSQVDTSFSALTKSSVGLGNVDNTSDATKNAAVATLTNKDLTSATNTFPTFNQNTTGNAATATKLATVRTINGVNFDGTANITVADSTKVPTTRTVNSKALSANITLDKTDIGLANVDNTSDASKPVSTATQAALDAKQPLDSDLTAIAALTVVNDSVLQGKAGAWTTRTPAQLKTDLALTKTDVGLSNVDNTADTAKPISTATQTALNLKADLVATPRYLVFNTTWPARPADSRLTIYVGGSSSTNAPTDSVAGDVWIPSS